MALHNKDKFGVGFIPDSEKYNVFAFDDSRIRFDDGGAGGAIPVRGYKGIWPLFGLARERLGGPDLIPIHDQNGKDAVAESSSSSSSSSISGSNSGKDSSPPSSSSSSSDDSIRFVKRPKWMCSPKSACLPCKKKERYRPYCQPYGNRVQVECRLVELRETPERKPFGRVEKDKEKQGEKVGGGEVKTTASSDAVVIGESSSVAIGNRNLRMSTISNEIFLDRRQEMFLSGQVYRGYQICGKNQHRESLDYAEFVGFNLILALIALYVLLIRQRQMASNYHSMLARRIQRE